MYGFVLYILPSKRTHKQNLKGVKSGQRRALIHGHVSSLALFSDGSLTLALDDKTRYESWCFELVTAVLSISDVTACLESGMVLNSTRFSAAVF